MTALLTMESLGLPIPTNSGKVREIYDLGENLLIVTTDRISAFDAVMENGIPDKGRVLNQLSAFWFKELGGVCPNHLISIEDALIRTHVPWYSKELEGRSLLARKARPLPVECVVRGYISGSLYKEYRSDGDAVHGLNLPPGLKESAKLPEPLFTPATKESSGHDRNLSWAETCEILGQETAEEAKKLSLELYRKAAKSAENCGMILADTKFEFGRTNEGLIWIDEALTPDSSRYWDAKRYAPGGPQPSYDKQFVRDYLESIGWDKQPPGPQLPDDVVAKTRAKYLEAFERITGSSLRLPE